MNSNIWQYSGTPQSSTSRKDPLVFCVTCLSTSNVRNMYPVVDKTFFSSITLIQVPSNKNLEVCWECNAVLEKIKKFRQRALKAQSMMSQNVNISMPDPLTTLGHSFNTQLSCVENEPEIINLNEQPLHTPIDTSVKEEAIETYVFSIQEDPFSLHSEIDVNADEEEQGCMDIIKCEYNSSDDEPLINSAAKRHLENSNQEEYSDTDSAIESSPQIPKPPHLVKAPHLTSVQTQPPTIPNISLPKPPSPVPKVDASSTVELPLGFVASSLLMSLPKTTESTTQKTQEKEKPVEYHTGPKLFKNSPQLAIPEMFRNVEPPERTTKTTTQRHTIKRMTQEQMNEYRAQRIKCARERHWKFFCEKCLEKFNKAQDYETHLKKHHKSAGNFMCTVCEVRLPTQEELDEHKELHYRLYVCYFCKVEFYTVKSLMRHNDIVHEDVLKSCRHCDKRFTNKKDFYMHNRTHIKRVQCEHCDKEMKLYILKRHIRDFHSPQPFLECGVCHKMVEGKAKLRNHMRNTHKPGVNGYCVECNVSFKTRALYLNHLKTSMKHRNDVEKLTCPHCSRSFSTSWSLKNHIKVYHENGELSQCDICKKTYKSKKAVRSHIMKFHLKLRNPSEQRNKICDICGKVFAYKACLEQHRNSHLKIRPYRCEECGATFSYSGARYTHIKLKHRKKQNNTNT